MDVTQILLAVVIIFGVILIISYFKICSEYMVNRKNKLRKPPRPSLIDQMLFYENNPFSWRIGFAFSMLGYNEEQIEQFNSALMKIVTIEKNIFDLSRKEHHEGLRTLISRVKPKDISESKILNYRDLLSSISILNQTNPEEQLKYILSLEIDRFLTDTAKSFRQNQINKIQESEDDSPF